MSNKLQIAWFSDAKWIWMFAPLTLLFFILSSIRRQCFQLGILKQTMPKLPVIVVGNISVGGNGKTPLTIAIVEYLKSRGYQPAVLSRGYGGNQDEFPYLVTPNCEASLVGDEPSLMAKRLNCVVVIDPKRVRGCEYIAAHTQANIIICDDGLQHYAMGRNVELCVIDKRGLGNGFLLPMGPLREGAWRLERVNALVYNQGFSMNPQLPQEVADANSPTYFMELMATQWVNLKTGNKIDIQATRTASQFFSQGAVTAIAGIGDPQRFFDTLKTLNIECSQCVAFDDHHAFSQQDIPTNGTVLMTEKDAVKCADFAHENCWYLQIDAQLPDAFFDQLIIDVKSPN